MTDLGHLDPFENIGDAHTFALCKLAQESQSREFFYELEHPQINFEENLAQDFLNYQFTATPLKPTKSQVDDSIPEKKRHSVSVDETTEISDEVSLSSLNSSPGFRKISHTVNTIDRTAEEFKEKSLKDKEPLHSNNWFTTTKKRKDVILKTVLRKARKFFQVELTKLTGFICSKKEKKDDPLVPSLQQLLAELPTAHPKMELLFFLGCLVYPQDTKRNVEKFISSEESTQEKSSNYLSLIQKIHDILYKYSHEKLESFCKVPALAHLFCHYYETSSDKTDPNYSEGYDYVHDQCQKTLRNFEGSI